MKKALRKSVAESLSQLSSHSIKQQSDDNALALSKLPEYLKAKRVAVYLHMDHGEARTDAVIARVFEDGKQLFLPKIVPLAGTAPQFANQKTHLQMRLVQSQAEIDGLLPQGRFNLREPETGDDCFIGDGLDLIVLPAVAFTTKCERLGHGKGFYDSFIQEHIQKVGSKPKLVGIGLAPQLVDSIPTESHDERLDAVIIDGHVYK